MSDREDVAEEQAIVSAQVGFELLEFYEDSFAKWPEDNNISEHVSHYPIVAWRVPKSSNKYKFPMPVALGYECDDFVSTEKTFFAVLCPNGCVMTLADGSCKNLDAWFEWVGKLWRRNVARFEVVTGGPL